MRFQIYVSYKHVAETCYIYELGLWILQRFQTAKVTFKLT